jgi:hypothetical protein
MEVDLLRGILGPGRRSWARKVSEERIGPAISKSATSTLSLARTHSTASPSGVERRGVYAAEAADPGAVCERDRDGARDLRGGSGVAALFRGQRARADAGAVGHAHGGVAESKRLGSGEPGADIAMASAANFAT